MNTKLTLRLDESLINQAKKYAKKTGKSISQVVSEYFKTIAHKSSVIKVKKHGPITSKLCGSLKGMRLSEQDYKKHLERKHL